MSFKDITVKLVLSDTYNTPQEAIDYAAKNSGRILLQSGDSTKLPFLELIAKFGFPSNIKSFINGFGNVSAVDRVTAIEMKLDSGYDVNSNNGELILKALKHNIVVSEFLFSHGARVYSPENELYRVNKERGGTVFHQVKHRNGECLIALLRHLFEKSGEYPQLFKDITDPQYNVSRIDVFTGYSLDGTIDIGITDIMVWLFKNCYDTRREETIKYAPRCTHLLARLVVDHGILFKVTPSDDFIKAVHALHADKAHADLAIRERMNSINTIISELRKED